jgi:hypothetical protein
MSTPAEIVETPVTGLPGRTPRDLIEQPKTAGRELEPVLLLDGSGSNGEPASPDSPMTKQELVCQVLPLIIGAFEADDSAALAAAAAGHAEEEGGGTRSYMFNDNIPIKFEEGEDESDDPRDLGDLNSANVAEKLRTAPWGGMTYIMPAVKAAERAYQAEFGDRPLRSRPAMELLVVTDGKLNDADEFEKWLAQADETCVVAVAIVGYGDGHDKAVRHYQQMAAANKFITYVALTGVSDPMEVAFDLRLLSGTAAS